MINWDRELQGAKLAAMIGKTISHYQILEKLGEGGMGEVYKARDVTLDRTVALKFLKPHVDDDQTARKRFINEAKTASALDHRNVATIYEIGQVEAGRTFIAMAFYGGASLSDEIQRAPLELQRALDVAIQVGEGLAEAHRHDIVHRDVKPANVIVTERGEAKILDFGLAKLAGQTRVTRTGTTMGTIGYMSPEQAQGAEVDRRTDVWALGALLYESLVGKPPFAGTHEQAIIYSIINEDPRPLTAQRAGLPLEIDRVVSKALAKNPAERYQSMDDMLVDLRHLRAEAKPSISRRASVAMPRGRAMLLVGAGLVAGIAIGAGLARWIFAPAPPEPPRVRIVTNSGADRNPVSSPDRKTIAFASTRAGVSQIWLKQLSTGNEIALTEGDDASPRFSPDGSQVLFTRREGTGSTLWRVSVLGGAPRRLIEDATEGCWSPDGSMLAFLRFATDGSGVWLAGADGANPRRIHRERVVGMRALSWSPDGRNVLAVVADPFGNIPTRFVIVSINGDPVRTIDPGAANRQTGTPIWLGSGDRIAYSVLELLSTASTGEASVVVERSIASGKVRELVSLPANCPDVSPMGQGQLLLGFEQRSQHLVLVAEPGTARERQRALTSGGSSDRQPRFSPDGRRVLFSSNRSGNLDLWTIDIGTRAMTRLTDDPAQDWDPTFTPDGSHILWSSNRTGHFEVWTAAADGSNARQLSHNQFGAENPTMTADGRWIVYSSYDSLEYSLWKMRPDGSEAHRFAKSMSMAEASPDPALITAATSTGTRVDRFVRVCHVDSETWWPASGRLGPSIDLLTGRPHWTGKNGIAYIDRDAAGRYGVMICDVSESKMGAPRPLAGFDPLAPTESFDVSKDGHIVVMSVRNSLQTIGVAQGLARVDASSR